MCSFLGGVSRWFTPLACGPGSPELSKSYMDMASKLFTFTFTLARGWYQARQRTQMTSPCRKPCRN